MTEPTKRYVPWVTIVLAAANVLVFAIELAAGGDPMWGPTPPRMLDLGGNFGPVTLNGEPWRLATSMFLHYGIIHLAANMYFGLYGLGRHVEGMVGRPSYLSLYLVSGLCGSLASAVFGRGVSAGASGAVFGLLGGFGAYLLVHKDRLDPVAVKAQARNLVGLIAVNVLIGVQARIIDMGAHIGGLVAGFVIGLALEARIGYTPGLGRRRLIRAIVIGIAGVALALGAAVVVPRPDHPEAVYDAVHHAEVVMQDIDGSKPSAAADLVERSVLPAWRKAIDAVERDRFLPDDMRGRILRYAQRRELQMSVLREAFRTGDQALLDRAKELGREADALVGELNAQSAK